jgi:hypothetical protein
MVKLVETERWASLIGRLFIAFGSIEQTTHECIRDWAGKQIHKHFARARLASRIELAVDLSSSQNASESTKREFNTVLAKARELSRYRNLVAHNPLCLVLFQNEINTPFLEAIASNVDDNKHILMKELVEVVESAEDCAEKLGRSFAMFRVEKIDFESLKTFPGLR